MPHDSDWLRFCQNEHPDFIPAFGYLYAPIDGLKIYTISMREDVDNLLSRYCHKRVKAIDFEVVARDYNAIHLATNSKGTLCHSHLECWDCECTLWFEASSLKYFGRVRLRRESAPPHPASNYE